MTIIQSTNDGEITGTTVGGIIGLSNGTAVQIKDCSNSGNIYGNSRVGGIAGYIGTNVELTGCSNIGTITAIPEAAPLETYPNVMIAGIVGSLDQLEKFMTPSKFIYSNLTNTGKITITDPENKFSLIYAGGILGRFMTLQGKISTLTSLTSNGPISVSRSSSEAYIGLLIGYLSAAAKGSTVSTINFNKCVVGTDSQVSLSGGINIIPYAVYGNPLKGNYAPKINLNNFTNSTVYAPYYTE